MRFPSPQRPLFRILAVAALVGLAASGAIAQTTTPAPAAFGTYLRPFAATSLWNTRPVNPVLSTTGVPKSSYFPSVSAGGFSTGVFQAASTDKPMSIYGPATTDTLITGVADPDSGGQRVVTVPRWPAGVVPASAADGHADIIDPVTKVIHSFWKLRQQPGGRWTAALYSWSKIDGTGWADPAHYYQGARAVGIPPLAGLIRKHEINDGKETYDHALAISLTYNALANGVKAPAYVFPATSADGSLGQNTGTIPYGALMMLPKSFDVSAITDPKLRKIAKTLQLYGAYVVDSNVGTPYVMYVEIGADFNLMPKGWDNSIAWQLDYIRSGLRQALSASDWIDGNGKSATAAIAAQKSLNLLSMRGPWYKQAGTAAASYNTEKQQLEYGTTTTTRATYANTYNTTMTKVMWAMPAVGTPMKFTSVSTGGASVRMTVTTNGKLMFDSGHLLAGQSARFTWPGPSAVAVVGSSGLGAASASKGELVALPQ